MVSGKVSSGRRYLAASVHRIKLLWSTATGSFWFLPHLIVALSIALGMTLVRMEDSALARWMHSHPELFGASASGAREMVSTIASSMMAVVGIVFSITLVALALASSQYSSRVLPTFMRSRLTQASLGTFAGIYVYCLIVLRGMHGEAETAHVPVLAVTAAALLALVGVMVLIFFIHHIALSIQAATILALICEETIGSVKQLFPEQLGESGPPPDADRDARLASIHWTPVPAHGTGYIQSMDEEGLLDVACKHQILIRMERGVGSFVIVGTPLFSISGAPLHDAAACKDLEATVEINRYRTVHQDPAFGIREMVDVALKALSPGINDTTTAIICIDYLTAIMIELARRAIPSPYRYVGGELKAIAIVTDYRDMLGEAYDQIRRSGVGNVSVLVRLADAFGTISGLATEPRRRAALAQQLDHLLEAASRGDLSEHDRELVRQRIAQARASLAATPAQGA